MNLTKPLLTCYWAMRTDRYATSVARRILPELRQAALRKFGDKKQPGGEFKQYVNSRAVQLAQPLVDQILKADRRMPGLLGNKLVLSAAAKAVHLVGKSPPRRALAA